MLKKRRLKRFCMVEKRSRQRFANVYVPSSSKGLAMNQEHCFSPERLAEIFPPSRADAFFEALFGGAEEGAYDIHLVAADDVAPCADELRFYFELRQRPGHCLVCSLTYGLPQVFERHPVIGIKTLIGELAGLAGWDQEEVWWRMGKTEGLSDALHRIPLVLLRHKGQE